MALASESTLLLPLLAKKSEDVDVGASLLDAIRNEYGVSGVAEAASACKLLTDSRRKALIASIKTSEDLQRRIAYARVVAFLLTTDAVRLESFKKLQAALVWTDSFDTSKNVRSNDLQFDRLAMTFNIAAGEAELGAACPDHLSASFLKESAIHFQRAAGYLNALQQEAPLDLDGDPTPDMQALSLSAFEMAMLANAQIFTYELAVLSKSMSGQSCARIAAGVRDLCDTIHRLCSSSLLRDSSMDWYLGRPAAVLGAIWDAEAHARVELSLGSAMDERLARIREASKEINRAETLLMQLKPSIALTDKLKTHVMNRKQGIASRYADVHAENIRIYVTTPLEHVDPVEARVMAKPISCQDVLTGAPSAGIYALASLGPSGLSAIVEQYMTMTRDAAASASQLTTTASISLREIIVHVESFFNIEAEVGIETENRFEEDGDMEAIEAIRIAQVEGGMRHLDALKEDIQTTCASNLLSIGAVEAILSEEAALDEKVHDSEAVADRVRSRSSVLTQEYHNHIASIKKAIDGACAAQEFVSRSIEDNRASIDQMCSLPIPEVASTGNKDKAQNESSLKSKAMNDLNQVLSFARKLLEVREDIVKELQTLQANENPEELTRKLAPSGALPDRDLIGKLVEEHFGTIQAKVNAYCSDVKSCTAQLETSLAGLKSIGQKRLESNALVKRRSFLTVYRHLAAAKMYAELKRYLEDGLSRHQREAGAIQKLKHDVQEFVASRSTEADEIMSVAESNRLQAKQEESLKRQRAEAAEIERQHLAALRERSENEERRRLQEDEAFRLRKEAEQLMKAKEQQARVKQQTHALQTLEISDSNACVATPSQISVSSGLNGSSSNAPTSTEEHAGPAVDVPKPSEASEVSEVSAHALHSEQLPQGPVALQPSETVNMQSQSQPPPTSHIGQHGYYVTPVSNQFGHFPGTHQQVSTAPFSSYGGYGNQPGGQSAHSSIPPQHGPGPNVHILPPVDPYLHQFTGAYATLYPGYPAPYAGANYNNPMQQQPYPPQAASYLQQYYAEQMAPYSRPAHIGPSHTAYHSGQVGQVPVSPYPGHHPSPYIYQSYPPGQSSYPASTSSAAHAMPAQQNTPISSPHNSQASSHSKPPADGRGRNQP